MLSFFHLCSFTINLLSISNVPQSPEPDLSLCPEGAGGFHLYLGVACERRKAHRKLKWDQGDGLWLVLERRP